MAGENINRRLNIYINDKEVVNSLSGITREMGKTRNELKNLNKNSVDYDADVARLTKHLKDLRDRQEEFTDELKLTNREMGAARENFSNLLGGLAVGDMRAVQEGLMGIRGSIVASSQAAWAFVTTPMGAFIAGLMAIGLATREWARYNDEVAKTNILVNGITSLSGEELDIVRVRAMALADYYGQDFKEVLNTAKANVKEFNVSYIEALDSIEDGLIKGGEANGEFLESMREYPTFFASAGYSIRDFQNLVNSGIDLGIYQDKLPDAIKEFALSVNEQTKGVSDALKNAFGADFTNKLLKGIKDGSISVKEALSLVSEEAKRVGLNAQQAQQLTADLFRGAGEDAGGALKIFEAVRHSIENQVRPLSDSEKATKELADSNLELAKAQDKALKSDGFERWKRNALLAINSVKKGWYDFISNLTNSEEDMIKNSKRKADETRVKDESRQFNEYMDSRRKRLGAAFDWEKERAERLADVMKRMNSGLQTDEWKKSFELQINAIKNAKMPTALAKVNPGQPSDADKKAGDDAAKKREKELADGKKHSEDLLKQLEASKKDLLATERSFDDLKLANQKDGYDKELALLNEEYSRKIEDTKSKVSQLQEEINKLNADAKNPSNSKADIAVINATIANKIAAQIDYSESLVAIERTRILKVASLQEKYLQKDIKDQEQANARALQNLQTKQNNELSSITSLEEAKAVLSNYLTEDELRKVTSLEEAKKKVKQQFQDEALTLQQKHLVEMMAQIQAVFEQENKQGIELITPEQREILLKFLDDAAAKLSALGISKAENNGEEANASKDLKSLSGIDILGFNPEQWQSAFDSLDTFAEKIAAVEMVVGAVKNAFGMYFQFLEAGEKRTMQKFEANNRKKQSDLDTQLEKGYITQEVYNARKSKLEAELAKKTAELEYKKAKRQKIQSAAEILINTGIAVSKAIAASPLTLGMPWSGIIAGLGAAQLGLVLAQPLPDKNGFYDGGYTGSGPERNSPGPVHYEEYVVPKKVLFSNDPVVPNIVGYLEAKRTGKNPQMPQEETNSTQMNQSGSSGNTMDVAVVNALNRNSLILEKIEEDGLPAYLVNDIKTAKKMRDKIKEVNKIETNAKL